MVVWRRTLFCKTGQTAPVVNGCKELARIVMEADDTIKGYIETFNTAPPEDRSWVLDALEGVTGVHSAYHVRDPERGSLLSISIFDDERGIQAAVEAISARDRPPGTRPRRLRIYEVVGHMWNR